MSSDKEMKLSVPFSPPDITEAEIEAVSEVLRSGWITTGNKTKSLEKKLAEWIGVGFSGSSVPRCVCLNSQTACAEMILRVLGVGPGDEVIVPAYTYTASASVVCHVGARPILVDICPENIGPDYGAIEAAVNEKTKAIIPVDVAGIPCDYDRLFDIVERKKNLFRPVGDVQKAIGRVAVLADTAHALGAVRRGVMAGNIADFSAFSFHAVKNLTTAEGGALTWKKIDGVDDDQLYHLFQLYSLHGQSKDALHKDGIGQWEYDIVGTWYKCNMTDVAAAMGLSQLERYPGMLARRRELIGKYDAAFRPLGVEVLDHYTEDYSSSGHLYLTWIPGIGDKERREIIIRMGEAGISCNVHYKPLPMHTAYKALGYDIADFPNAFGRYENEITLPLHTRLTDEQAEYVIGKFSSIAKEYIR